MPGEYRPKESNEDARVAPGYKQTEDSSYLQQVKRELAEPREADEKYPKGQVIYTKFQGRLERKKESPEKLLEHSEILPDQGVFFSDISLHLTLVSGNEFEVHQIHFPYVVVLTQTCDAHNNHKKRTLLGKNKTTNSHNGIVLSILVAPVFPLDKIRSGEHFETLKMTLDRINSDSISAIKNDKFPRYHYIKEDYVNEKFLTEGIIDFKHFFTCSYFDLANKEPIGKFKDFHREKLSQRFAYYLSRIGIP